MSDSSNSTPATAVPAVNATADSNIPTYAEVVSTATTDVVRDEKPAAVVIQNVHTPTSTTAENEAAAVAKVVSAAVPGQISLDSNDNTPGAASSNSIPDTIPGGQPISASLYVGDLHPEVTENILYEMFQAVGPVLSARVCRDVITRSSLGYGYINFYNIRDAKSALETMNHYASPLTKDKPLRLMWKINDPSARKKGVGNIFVKSLTKDIDNKALYDTFSQFGPIMSCKVAVNDQGESLGYGFVHFNTAEAAAEAIAKVNGMLLNGSKVYVGKFLTKREREAAGQVKKSFTNVFVKNLHDRYCIEEKLKEIFSEYGDITSIHVPVGDNGKGKGFAFVNFSNPEMAARAVEDMNGKEYEGQAIFVGRAQKRFERKTELRKKYEQIRQERMEKNEGLNLYVKHFSDDVDDEKLRKEFSKFGTITSCKIMRSDKGLSRGFGFVCFTQPEEATKALTELNGRKLFGKKPLYVTLAQPKNVRHAHLAAQHARTMHLPAPGLAPSTMYRQPSPYIYENTATVHVRSPGAMTNTERGISMNPTRIPMRPIGHSGRGMPITAPYITPMGRGQSPTQPSELRGPRRSRRGRRRNRQVDSMASRRAVVQPTNTEGRVFVDVQNQNGMHNQYSSQLLQQFIPQQQPLRAVPHQEPPSQLLQAATGQSQCSEPLTLEMLTSATPEQRKQMLGEKLYSLIAEKQSALASKITGMILEMENPDILHLLESPEALTEQVNEALEALRSHEAPVGTDAVQTQSNV